MLAKGGLESGGAEMGVSSDRTTLMITSDTSSKCPPPLRLGSHERVLQTL